MAALAPPVLMSLDKRVVLPKWRQFQSKRANFHRKVGSVDTINPRRVEVSFREKVCLQSLGWSVGAPVVANSEADNLFSVCGVHKHTHSSGKVCPFGKSKRRMEERCVSTKHVFFLMCMMLFLGNYLLL